MLVAVTAMTTSSLIPGTALDDQFPGVFQLLFVPLPPTQFTVAALTALLAKSSASSVSASRGVCGVCQRVIMFLEWLVGVVRDSRIDPGRIMVSMLCKDTSESHTRPRVPSLC